MKTIKLRYQEVEDYLRRYINIYSALAVKEELWLTPREKDFFIACVILYNQGISLSSKRGTAFLEKKSNFKKETKGVYIYRNKLKSKGWLANTKDGLIIPKSFIFNKGIKNIDFKISLEYDAQEDSRSS